MTTVRRTTYFGPRFVPGRHRQVAELDTDGSGGIDLSEFKNWLGTERGKPDRKFGSDGSQSLFLALHVRRWQRRIHNQVEEISKRIQGVAEPKRTFSNKVAVSFGGKSVGGPFLSRRAFAERVVLPTCTMDKAFN